MIRDILEMLGWWASALFTPPGAERTWRLQWAKAWTRKIVGRLLAASFAIASFGGIRRTWPRRFW